MQNGIIADRNKDNFILWLVVFSFAPYLWPDVPLPVGSLFVYLIFVWLFVKNRCILFKIDGKLQVFFFMFFGLIVFGLLSTMLNVNYNAELLIIKKLSQLETSLRPLFLLGIWGYVNKGDYEASRKLLSRVTYFFVFALFINTVLVVLSIFIPKIPEVLKMFHTYDFTHLSVAEESAVLGRYTGIFCQPINAGFAYSLGLLLLVYAFKKNPAFTIMKYVLLLSLLVGGMLVLSKVFMYVGLFLFLIYGILKKNVFLMLARERIFYIFLPVSVAAIVCIFFIWSGKDFVVYLLNFFREKDLLFALTSGRYGAETNGFMSYMLNKYGSIVGAGYGLTTFDSGYLYYFLITGVGGFFIFVLLNAYMFFLAICKKSEENRLLLFIVLLFVIANLGAPIGVEPMVSTVFWIIIFSLTEIVGFDHKVESGERHG